MGRIGAAHGIKGEVRIQSFTEDPLAIMDYGPLATNRPGLTVEITDARTTTNVLVARIKGKNQNGSTPANGHAYNAGRAEAGALQADAPTMRADEHETQK